MSLIWKNRMYSLYKHYAHLDEVKEFEPLVYAAVLVSPKFWSDGVYNYCLSKDGLMVVRIVKLLARTPGSCDDPPREKAEHGMRSLK